MSRARIRWPVGILVVSAWGAVVWFTVIIPLVQVRELKLVVWRTDYVSVQEATSRNNLQRLEAWREWDPYLQGWRDLYRARNYRKLGRVEEAIGAYDRALQGRVPAHVLVEAGVYEIERGRNESGERKLLLAAAYSGALLDEIEDPGWRSYIQEKLYSEGLPSAEQDPR